MTDVLFHDPPADAAVRADNAQIVTEVNGSRIRGRVFLPALEDTDQRTPVVLFLHGCPGIEKNIDLAQLVRMAGIASAGFFYRGVWGSEGDYCFSHLVEDAAAVASWLRENAERLRIDPDRLYLFGHSMGGFAAVQAVASGLRVKGVFLAAPCDIAERYLYEPEAFASLLQVKHEGYFTLPCEDYIENDVSDHAAQWYFPTAAQRMDVSIPYYFIGGARDATTPPQRNILPLLNALRERGAQPDYLELDDSHNFPCSRFRLANAIVDGVRKTEMRGVRNAE